jgi:hypothetical protein
MGSGSLTPGISGSRSTTTAEVPIVAARAHDHRELQVLDDLVWVEVVDEENQPVPVGTPGYRCCSRISSTTRGRSSAELTDS